MKILLYRKIRLSTYLFLCISLIGLTPLSVYSQTIPGNAASSFLTFDTEPTDFDTLEKRKTTNKNFYSNSNTQNNTPTTDSGVTADIPGNPASIFLPGFISGRPNVSKTPPSAEATGSNVKDRDYSEKEEDTSTPTTDSSKNTRSKLFKD